MHLLSRVKGWRPTAFTADSSYISGTELFVDGGFAQV